MDCFVMYKSFQQEELKFVVFEMFYGPAQGILDNM